MARSEISHYKELHCLSHQSNQMLLLPVKFYTRRFKISDKFFCEHPCTDPSKQSVKRTEYYVIMVDCVPRSRGVHLYKSFRNEKECRFWEWLRSDATYQLFPTRAGVRDWSENCQKVMFHHNLFRYLAKRCDLVFDCLLIVTFQSLLVYINRSFAKLVQVRVSL